MPFLPGEEARAVISQRAVVGRDSTAEEQADYLHSKGFHTIGEDKWVHPVTGGKVWDTITPGNAITDAQGGVHPIDLQIAPASPEEWQRARAVSGLGGEGLFGTRTTTAGPGPETQRSLGLWRGAAGTGIAAMGLHFRKALAGVRRMIGRGAAFCGKRAAAIGG